MRVKDTNFSVFEIRHKTASDNQSVDGAYWAGVGDRDGGVSTAIRFN